MRQFFKPWRRKMGILTLLMACVFAAGWVRSISKSETLAFRMWRKSLCVRSYQGAIKWRNEFYHFEINPNPPVVELVDTAALDQLEGTMGKLDLLISRKSRQNMWIGGIPYWSIVIPLTLISTWLVLSKPRRRKAPAEPVTEKAA